MLSRRVLTLLSTFRAASPVRPFSTAAALPRDDDNRHALADDLAKHSYRTIDVRLRVPGARERRRLLKLDDKRIPGILQARGAFDDILLDVPLQPLLDAHEAGLLTRSKKGKVKFEGPLFVLRLHDADSGALHQWDAPDAQKLTLPLTAIRAKPVNITLHPLTERPEGVSFVLAPADRATRVRVPVRVLNEEKSPGVKMGGWVNVIDWAVDVRVDVGVVPPLVATVDVGGLGMKDRLTLDALQFDGKGEGCRLVRPADTVSTVISPV